MRSRCAGRVSAVGAALRGRAGPLIRKHRMLCANLATAFPEWSPAEVERMARASWAQLGRVIAEFPHFAALFDPADPRVEVVDPHRVLSAAAAGRPVILAGAHLGNWELLAAAAVQRGVPLTVVHAARANPGVESMVERHRRALGCGFLEQGESVHAMLRQIRQGRSIGVLVDQRYDKGEAVPFFDREAMTSVAPALLAVRFGLPFVPARCERLQGCRFRVTYEPPLAPDPNLREPRAVARDLTRRLNERFAAWISERPAEWLCIKRRWPAEQVVAAAPLATALPYRHITAEPGHVRSMS